MTKRPQGKGDESRRKAGAAAGKPSAAARTPFLLRLPPELLEELRGWASQELRSLNGHMEYLLRDAIRRRKGGGDP